MDLCLPAKFQVFIVVVNVLIVLYTATGIISLIPSLLFTGFFGYIWILFLNCLCANDYNWLSWTLIVIGMTVNIIMWVLLYSAKNASKNQEESDVTEPALAEETVPAVDAPAAPAAPAALPPPTATSVRPTPSPAATNTTAASVTTTPPKTTTTPSPAGSPSTVVK